MENGLIDECLTLVLFLSNTNDGNSEYTIKEPINMCGASFVHLSNNRLHCLTIVGFCEWRAAKWSYDHVNIYMLRLLQNKSEQSLRIIDWKRHGKLLIIRILVD